MSGGHWDYKDSSLKSEIFDWSDKPSDQFEDMEISQLVWDVLELMHDYDWYASGDTSKQSYLDSKKAFKDKWFGDRKERLEAIIENRINEVTKELKDIL